MSRKFTLIIAALSVFLFLASCEKEIHIDLGSSAEQLVVQGGIESGLPPYVILTHTIGFFSNVDLGSLQNTFVHGAQVTVSDGTHSVDLKEYALDTGASYKFYAYYVDTSNHGANIIAGTFGKTYTLTIKYNGVTYNSVTTIPFVKGLDTIYFAPPVFKRKKTPLNALEMFGTYTDPDTPGNYVRYFTRRNNHDNFYPGSVFTDELVNGKTITNVDLFAGYNDSLNVNVDSVIYFYPGDTVTLKWCEIDKGVYNFWNTYQFSLQSAGNPFSTPINAQTNITGGALGVWAGYGAIYKTVTPH